MSYRPGWLSSSLRWIQRSSKPTRFKASKPKLLRARSDCCSQVSIANLSQLREETGTSFKNLGDSVLSTLTGISQMQNAELTEMRNTVDTRLLHIQVENEKKLEQMRQTVDEKLQGTLESRLGESFKQVSERLEQVYTGLGEMKTLATGVGDLKRVLTNVKTRGTWGEVQLGAIIEEILAPDQFRKNVATARTDERVEYAVKLPGRDSHGEPVWLPIDAKFPFEDYQRLLYASELGDVESVDRASRQLEVDVAAKRKESIRKVPCTARDHRFRHPVSFHRRALCGGHATSWSG